MFFGCTNSSIEITDNHIDVLAIVDKKIITVNDFIKRAEYNVRPVYCSGNSYNDKKIILNSLIAEKIFALNTNLEMKNSHIDLIEGRKEQKMREVYFNRYIYNATKVDSTEISNVYHNSKKKFHISYLTLPKKDQLLKIHNLIIDSSATLDSISKYYFNLEEVPKRKLSFIDDFSDEMYLNFFSNNIKVGDIFGPIKIGNNYTIFRVDDWTQIKNLSSINLKNEIASLTKTIKQTKSNIKYRKYINRIMKGKELEINPDTYEELVKNIYNSSINDSEKKSNIKIKNLYINKELKRNNFNEKNIFTLDGENWTIDDLNNLIKKNPIELNSDWDMNLLKRELKKIIIQKLEIFYVTREAYKNKIDSHFLVKQEESNWEDYIKSNHLISSMAKTAKSNLNGKDLVSHVLNPYFDSLSNEYSDKIEINEDKLSDIKLSKIDMHAFYKNQSYDLVVPLFPHTTSSLKQNYLNHN